MDPTLQKTSLGNVAMAVAFVLMNGVLVVASSLAFQPLVQML